MLMLSEFEIKQWIGLLSHSFIKVGEQDTKTKNHKKTKDNNKKAKDHNKEAKDHDKETKADEKADNIKEAKDNKGTKGVKEETRGSQEVKRQETKKGAGKDLKLILKLYLPDYKRASSSFPPIDRLKLKNIDLLCCNIF